MSSLATPSLAVPSYLASPVANLQESTMVRRSAGWQKSKDQLYAWMSVPSLEFDEGDVPPSANTLAMAMDLATQLADQNEPPPLMVSPDGNGGVVFGWNWITRPVRVDEPVKARLRDGDTTVQSVRTLEF